MDRSIALRGLGTLVLCAAAADRASVAPVPYSEMASSAYMAPDKSDASGRVPYRYSTPVDWRAYNAYNKVILDPVVLYRGKDHQFGDMSDKDKDKATLAAYMQNSFAERLRGRFALVRERGPNTLRIRLTLTGAVTNTPVLGTLSRFDLAGAVYNGVQAARDGEGTMTGSVVYGVEIFDAATSRLLSAYVTKQYPGAYDIKASVGALAAATAGLDKGADALMAQLN
ncbi:hypothetical protein ACVI1J_004701 [Bradyrhizobium diazoefficiens]